MDAEEAHVAAMNTSLCPACDKMQERFNELSLKEGGGGSKKSVIHVSAHMAHTNCVLAAIASGTDVDQPDSNDMTPLMIAAQKANTDTVVALVEAGADIHIDDINGHTPLYICTINGDVRAVRCLLDAGALDGQHSTWYVSDMKIAMREALSISQGKTDMEDMAECIRLLGDHGVNISELFDASYLEPKTDWDHNSWDEVFQSFPAAVLEQIVMLFLQEKGYILNDLCTAALAKGTTRMFVEMLEQNVRMEEGEDGKRLLDPANIPWLLIYLPLIDRVDLLKTLLRHPPETIQRHINDKLYSRTPMEWACKESSRTVEVVRELLYHGANPDVGDIYAGGPVFAALEKMTDHKSAMDVFVCILRYNCDLGKERYHITAPQTLANITPMDAALLGCNLYAARIMLLAGVQSWNSVLLGDPKEYLVPETVRCSHTERASFIQEHLHGPHPLYIQCRKKIRQVLGVNADEKIQSLGLAEDLQSFLKFTDVDKIAEEFIENFGDDNPE